MSKVKGLKGVTPEYDRKPKYYVFAMSAQDYHDFTNKLTEQDRHDWEFVYVQHLDDVRPLRNIQWIVTSGVERNPAYHKCVKEVMEIVNFEYADKVNIEHLPKVIQELMNESLPQTLKVPCNVGDLVICQTEFPAIGVKKGDVGVVFDIYGSGDTQIIFRGGGYSGFSAGEMEVYLDYLDHFDLDYKFDNVHQLNHDYERGYFDDAFNAALNCFPF